jgi:hypothetical protein
MLLGLIVGALCYTAGWLLAAVLSHWLHRNDTERGEWERIDLPDIRCTITLTGFTDDQQERIMAGRPGEWVRLS